MTTYAVTGASGHLGRLVVEELLRRGVPEADVVAVVRTPAKVADLTARGVQVREGDYDRPETLGPALAGVQRLLLVSGSEPGGRVRQHTAVIDAAAASGVQRIAYTSILHADTTTNPLAPEHRETEQVLRGSGLAVSLLRNGWYTENYTAQLNSYLERGEILGSAGTGRVSAATRADFAAATVAVLLADDPAPVYELAGPSFDFRQLAATISDVTGATVRYRDLAPDGHVAALVQAGLDEGTAAFVASLDASIAAGELETDSPDLEVLLARPATPLTDAVRTARG